jgi:hypothetical protein
LSGPTRTSCLPKLAPFQQAHEGRRRAVEPFGAEFLNSRTGQIDVDLDKLFGK